MYSYACFRFSAKAEVQGHTASDIDTSTILNAMSEVQIAASDSYFLFFWQCLRSFFVRLGSGRARLQRSREETITIAVSPQL